MMLVIVEFELVPGQEGEFETLLGEMQERVKQYDGYLGEEPCRSLLDENRFITLFRFRDQAAIASWKQDAEHLRTQRLGRERVFAWYKICVSEIQRAYTLDVLYLRKSLHQEVNKHTNFWRYLTLVRMHCPKRTGTWNGLILGEYWSQLFLTQFITHIQIGG